MYLCVCQYGHSRSVALTRVLHMCHVEAIAVGYRTSPDWLHLMSGVADKILILDSSYRRHILPVYHDKIIDMHVGPDRWANPYHKELLTILAGLVKDKLGLIPPQQDGHRYRAVEERGFWYLEVLRYITPTRLEEQRDDYGTWCRIAGPYMSADNALAQIK